MVSIDEIAFKNIDSTKMNIWFDNIKERVIRDDNISSLIVKQCKKMIVVKTHIRHKIC